VPPRNKAPADNVRSSMAIPSFAVTWDYRCPFARNVHEMLVTGLLDGADWDVRMVPFCLGQTHVGEDQPDVWDAPELDTGLLALQVGVVVRDRFAARFASVHGALFEARHDDGLHLRDEGALRSILAMNGVDADAVFDEVRAGWPLETVRKEHEEVAASHDVWGVPTFILGGSAAFVRLMEHSNGDGGVARRSVERIVDLLGGWPELNEFKHTSIER